MDSPAGHALEYEQVRKLYKVLSEPVQIQPTNNFPVLDISPASIVKVVRQRLLRKGITLRDIRLNGSAASYCLSDDREDLPKIDFNDVDLIFGVSVEREYDFHVIKDEVLMSLLEFFPEDAAIDRISCPTLEETYVRKMVLVSNKDNKWSLISLGEGIKKSIELKFVSVIKRQFEFTVDSFQIILDSYFDFGQCTEESPVTITQSFFPSVQAVSIYRNFSEAMGHLNNRQIHTEAPEEIRGGGLLKYCSLRVNGFKPADQDAIEKLEPYMCSRFFIDFPSTEAQYHKLMKYAMRFLCTGQVQKCIGFLDTLFQVVNSRAKCLMENQRHKTISVILEIRTYAFSLLPIFPFIGPPQLPGPLCNSSPFTFSTSSHYGPGADPLRTSPTFLNFHVPQWPVPAAQVR